MRLSISMPPSSGCIPIVSPQGRPRPFARAVWPTVERLAAVLIAWIVIALITSSTA